MHNATKPWKIVVVGGGYAGIACAARLARTAGAAVQVTLVNASEHFVERIRLHQAVAGQVLPRHALRPLLARAGVQFIVGHAQGIDLDARAVDVDGTRLPWDRLVIATGSRAGRPVDAASAAAVHTLDPDGVSAAAKHLQALDAGSRVLVVGGGLTGVEAATEVAESMPHLQVTLASRGPVLAGWSDAARAHVFDVFARLGIRWREGWGIGALRPGQAVPTQGEPVPFDLCLWTAGFGWPTLAAGTALAAAPDGQVRVDSMLRSVSHPAVYAAGDIARLDGATDEPWPMGCKSALPTGAHVADNLVREVAGLEPEPFAYRLPFYCVSLGRRDGVIQWPDAAGGLHGPVRTGTQAAQLKERVCAGTWQGLVDESEGRHAIRPPEAVAAMAAQIAMQKVRMAPA